ncbi:MAG TPA: hypothetical protein VMR98_03130, partial [Candidatus Polarisedimenticolaceae bacterium]|nr:hypothetical protein [Candidatus Polarisedimenticolaceae bacterium]
MEQAPTETALTGWRSGQTPAERLAAEILIIEGYSGVDPQSPLGGPDGLKDIICIKDNKTWVVGCYFPPTTQTFKQVKKKFLSDFSGVSSNRADGFIFVTNQRISPSKRAELVTLVTQTPVELYHIERLRALLDTPKGYGIRMEYLRIPMTGEEQVSLWSALKDNLTDRFVVQEKALSNLDAKIEEIIARTTTISANLAALPSSLAEGGTARTSLAITRPTAAITKGQLLWLHAALMDYDSSVANGFRNVTVWIGGSSPDKATFLPEQPERVQECLDRLLANWRKQYPHL